jgi:hypothetical protein
MQKQSVAAEDLPFGIIELSDKLLVLFVIGHKDFPGSAS